MADYWIKEFADIAAVDPEKNDRVDCLYDDGGRTTQQVTFTTSTASAAFQSDTRMILVTVEARCHFEIGETPVATSASFPLEPGVPYTFGVPAGAGFKFAGYDGSS